ncbi:response regulator transcription factor [Pararhizobium mangrovi]|nr:response regulator transcription factor [Pararhizobium mangrovi]
MTFHIRAIIVDDHPVVAAGVRALLETSDDIECVGVAETAAAGMALASECSPDVAILDVSLPDMSGFELARWMLKHHAGIEIVMMTLLHGRAYVEQALQLGAKGFIQKRSAGQNLLNAVRSAAIGSVYLDPPSAHVLQPNPDAKGKNGTAGQLTRREENVLRMVALGYGNKEIAWRLRVSIKSIETYKARATEKLQLRSRAEIVRFGVTSGWFEFVEVDQETLEDADREFVEPGGD